MQGMTSELTVTNSIVTEFGERVLARLGLNEAPQHILFKNARQRRYSRKHLLLTAGGRWSKLYYVHHGLLRLFYVDIEGREFNKSFFWEGHCIWPVAPRDRNEPVRFCIAAVEECILLEVDIHVVCETLQRCGKWEEFALPFAETLLEQKFDREHDLLLLSARQRYEKLCETNIDMVERIPDYHLASLLGITNVSLSRIKAMGHD